MKPAPLMMLLAALALLGLRLRLDSPGDLAAGVFATAPGSPEAERDAWRLRLVELALADGGSAREDLHLNVSEVGWPPLFTLGLAQLARRTGVTGPPGPEREDDRGARLRSFVERALSASGALAILAVFLCARALSGGPAADVTGLVAAGAYALLPPIVFAERAGRVDPHAWSTLLGCGLLASAALALRARQEVDATLGGLLAGVAAGLAFACDVGSLALTLSALVALGVLALRGRTDLRRGCTLFVVAAAVAATMPWELPSWERLVPQRMPWVSGAGFERLRAWPAVAILPAALIALGTGPRRRERLLLQVLAVAAIAWALLVDADAAGVHLAAVLAGAVAVGDACERAPASRRALPIAISVLLASPALLFARAPSFAVPADEVSGRRALALELARLGRELPAPVPWNHPSARSDWRVLCAPGFGASTAVRLRLPVLAARLPGLVAGEPERAALRSAARLLGSTDPDGFAVEALRADVAYVVLTRAMTGDPLLAPALAESGGRSMLERLLAGEPVAGLERLLPAGGAPEPGVEPVLFTWRVSASAGRGSESPPVLRSR